MTKAEIIKDSVNTSGKRLTTWILTYPRFVHAELMTHRMFSKNAASSRAIPFNKFLENVKTIPAIPIWTLNQSGMQGKDLEDEQTKEWATSDWLSARDEMMQKANDMYKDYNVHKANVNRLLEPWFHITVLFTGTDHENFFKLRAHKDALPEFSELAHKMLEKYNTHSPTSLPNGSWHIPFEGQMSHHLDLATKLKIAVARCARLSYINFDGEISVEKDVDLFNKLRSSGHFSPFEHIALAYSDAPQQWGGNFGNGWIQYRKLIPNENQKDNRVTSNTKVKTQT